MSDIKRTETRVGHVTLVEFTYPSGFVEISAHVDELIKGAGPITVAVISRQPGHGSKWCIYPAKGNDVFRSRNKRKAIEIALDLGERVEMRLPRPQRERITQ
jgi:hypothetical protein